MSSEMAARLKDAAAQQGLDVADVVRRAIARELDQEPPPNEYPVLGYIPGGQAAQVVAMPPGTMVRPPFHLNPDSYALLVTGNSMECDSGLSIPDGSYAFFAPQQVPPYMGIIHCEWPSPSGHDNVVTLKRYMPLPNGDVRLDPLNPKFKPILRKAGEPLQIRGVFLKAWDGKHE